MSKHEKQLIWEDFDERTVKEISIFVPLLHASIRKNGIQSTANITGINLTNAHKKAHLFTIESCFGK